MLAPVLKVRGQQVLGGGIKRAPKYPQRPQGSAQCLPGQEELLRQRQDCAALRFPLPTADVVSGWGHGCGSITLGSSSLLGHKCLGRVLGFPGQSRPQPCAILVGGTLQPGEPGECWHGAAGARVSFLPHVPSSLPRALPISCRQKKLRSPQPQEMQHKAERGNSETMSSILWTEPRQRHRALVPAGTLPGSVNVCAHVRACVRVCTAAARAACRGCVCLYESGVTGCAGHAVAVPKASSLLGDVPQGTGDGVPHRTSVTCTPRLSHAGGLN